MLTAPQQVAASDAEQSFNVDDMKLAYAEVGLAYNHRQAGAFLRQPLQRQGEH